VRGRTFADGDVVRLSNSGGALPAGLERDTDYHVRDSTGTTFKLAATAGGSAIDITAAGTGLHFAGVIPSTIVRAMKLLIGHWYEQREEAVAGSLSSIPMGAAALLGSEWSGVLPGAPWTRGAAYG
jgi:hypothetical protein